ncbi:MAG TPA: hypothetical protein VK280_21830 [Streptosporangiaceae bacterium]|nr:hypothetical protein [Streptosporangiaceae bacterium]
MSEDAPVNAGAVAWPHPDSAWFTIRSMLTKLHRWAGNDVSRRFGDSGAVFTGASSVNVTSYRYRGSKQADPMDPETSSRRPWRLTSG